MNRHSAEVVGATKRPFDVYLARRLEADIKRKAAEEREKAFDSDNEQSGGALMAGFWICIVLCVIAWALFGMSVALHAAWVWAWSPFL